MKLLLLFWSLLFSSSIILISCSRDEGSYITLESEDGEEFSGGENTSFNFSPESFGFAAPNLTFDERVTFGVGNSLFNQNWVTAPASTTARDGLGPLFNARNCSSCHFKDGRGRPPQFTGDTGKGLLIRLSLTGTDVNGSSLPDPIYGSQFQDVAILGITKEGTLDILYTPIEVTYTDGTSITLQKPTYNFIDLGYGPLSGNILKSPRIANQMIGLGLLDAIPESTLISFSDPADSDGDGISGRPNYVYDIASNSTQIGRFGWKANQPNIKQQVAAAFHGDLGITSPLFPDENCNPILDCGIIPNGGSPELILENLDRTAFYSSAIAVPARRDFNNQDVLLGKQIFNNIQCASCHKPKIQTGSHAIAALANQTIRPYTDLLLHDMGENLADSAPDFEATGSEWRTAPLWGLGLIETVNGHTNLLHDGRARNIEEAILWHGGEATKSINKFKSLTLEERNQILLFLNTV
jgi:CxxC motif-containing protein (DUF1111 family)